jgi:hypothetical protein
MYISVKKLEITQIQNFSHGSWKALNFISFVPTEETKQRKTPGEYN